MRKTTLFVPLAFLLLISIVNAEPVIMPYDCNGTATNNFSAGEDICVYGLGFQENQDVDFYLLENKDTYEVGSDLATNALQKETINTGNGFLGLKKLFNALVDGIYDIFADTNNDGRLDRTDVLNAGNPLIEHQDEGTEDDLDEDVEDVPEFSTIAALLTLAAAGIIIAKRRGANQ